MNENQEIFTAEQFRAQAVELSQAMAELHRRDSRRIDPQDPFENETEFHDFQPDYAEIVPQIRIPGCRIPLKPNDREKRNIRRFLNIVGGFLLAHMIVSNVLGIGIETLFVALISLVDQSITDLPENYSMIASDYFWGSSSAQAMSLLVYGITNVMIVWIGCRATKIPIPNLFQTKIFNAMTAFGYICVGLLIQLVTGHMAVGVDTIFESLGIPLYEPEMENLTDQKTLIISVIYSCLVAPVTEELLMRGFVLKNLSRVSQKFGIVMSAFLFGIWHENAGQFILAFFGGLLFGYIDVKHNSLVPSIICHIFINTAAEISYLCESYGWDTATMIVDSAYMFFVLIGLVNLIRMLIMERFPTTTPLQAERGLRQVFASPLMLIVIAGHIGAAVFITLRMT